MGTPHKSPLEKRMRDAALQYLHDRWFDGSDRDEGERNMERKLARYYPAMKRCDVRILRQRNPNVALTKLLCIGHHMGVADGLQRRLRECLQ